MSNYSELEKIRRDTVRWRILKALNTVRSFPMGEILLLEVLSDAQLPVTETELRDQLLYLEDKGFLRIREKFRPKWVLEISATGVDVAEYSVECPPGVARPSLL